MATKGRSRTPNKTQLTKRAAGADGSNPTSLGTSGLFINRLLFSIIAAYPSSAKMSPQRRHKEQKNRLSAARLTLFNLKTSREFDDYDALYFMASHFIRDEHKKAHLRDFKCRSIRQLAKEASGYALGTGTKASIEDRLRSGFTRHKGFFIDLVLHSDDIEPTIEDQVLKDVAKLIEPYLAMDVEARLGRPEKKRTL
jgi:hypothetical protein